MKNYTTKIKSLDSLSKLPTKRLLAYYKARRKDRIALVNFCSCDCCGSTSWELEPRNPDALKMKAQHDALENHLGEVKQMLNQRENVRK